MTPEEFNELPDIKVVECETCINNIKYSFHTLHKMPTFEGKFCEHHADGLTQFNENGELSEEWIKKYNEREEFIKKVDKRSLFIFFGMIIISLVIGLLVICIPAHAAFSPEGVNQWAQVFSNARGNPQADYERQRMQQMQQEQHELQMELLKEQINQLNPGRLSGLPGFKGSAHGKSRVSRHAPAARV